MALVTVACDESGNEGENLSRAGSRVFAHASTTLQKSAADRVIAQVRAETGSGKDELKSGVLLKPQNRDVAESLLLDTDLAGHATVHLTDKRYFLCGKIVDLVIETHMHELGHNVYAQRRARDMARALFYEGPAQLGSDFDGMLDAFNMMLRLKVRTGATLTLDDFYAALDTLRPRASGKLGVVLRIVHAGRASAESLVRELPETSQDYLALDPLYAALGVAVRHWHERTGLAVAVVHDETSLLTPQRVSVFMEMTGGPGVPEHRLPPVPVNNVSLVDSRSDSRIQVADLMAGICRDVALAALEGDNSHPLMPLVRPFINEWSLWGDDSSWKLLTADSA